MAVVQYVKDWDLTRLTSERLEPMLDSRLWFGFPAQTIRHPKDHRQQNSHTQHEVSDL